MNSKDLLVRVNYPWNGSIRTTYFGEDGIELSPFYPLALLIAFFRRHRRRRRRR